MPLNGIPSAILAKYRKSRGARSDVTRDNPKIEATPGSLTSQVRRGQPGNITICPSMNINLLFVAGASIFAKFLS